MSKINKKQEFNKKGANINIPKIEVDKIKQFKNTDDSIINIKNNLADTDRSG